MRNKEKGFTLVELLVVVGILAILGAVVFPTVQNALNKSREAQGLQNMRQLADALISYVSDTNAYPASETILGSGLTEVRQRWFNILAPYIGVQDGRSATNAGGQTSVTNAGGDNNQEVFNQVMVDPLVRGSWKIGENNSIGYNYQYLGNARPTGFFRDPAAPPPGDFAAGPPTNQYSIPAGGRKSNGYVNYPVYSQDIQAPDRTIAFAYSDGTGHIGPYRAPEYAYPDTGTGGTLQFATGNASESLTLPNPGSMDGNRLTTLGNRGFEVDPTFLPIRDIDPTNNATPGVVADATDMEVAGAAGSDVANGITLHCQAARSVVTNRYDGGTIVAYADGHVQYLKREAVYIDPRSGRPTNRLWNGFGRDNDENANGLMDTNEAVIDNNEWIATDGQGGFLVNTICNNRTSPTGAQNVNGSFLQGNTDLRNPTDTPVRGGTTTQTVQEILEGAKGPTLPKVAPFPILVSILGDTLVNTSPTVQ